MWCQVALLKKAKLDDRLSEFFPPSQRGLEQLNAHFKVCACVHCPCAWQFSWPPSQLPISLNAANMGSKYAYHGTYCVGSNTKHGLCRLSHFRLLSLHAVETDSMLCVTTMKGMGFHGACCFSSRRTSWTRWWRKTA